MISPKSCLVRGCLFVCLFVCLLQRTESRSSAFEAAWIHRPVIDLKWGECGVSVTSDRRHTTTDTHCVAVTKLSVTVWVSLCPQSRAHPRQQAGPLGLLSRPLLSLSFRIS